MMKKLFIASYILALAFVFVAHTVLPDDVAIHFNGRGEADDWAPKTVNTLLFAGLMTFFLLLFWWIPKLLVAVPPSLVNLPNKDYWLAEDNIDRALVIFSDLMYEFGAAMMGYFTLVLIMTAQANLQEPVALDNASFLSSLAIFMVYTVWWCVRLVRAFRLP